MWKFIKNSFRSSFFNKFYYISLSFWILLLIRNEYEIHVLKKGLPDENIEQVFKNYYAGKYDLSIRDYLNLVLPKFMRKTLGSTSDANGLKDLIYQVNTNGKFEEFIIPEEKIVAGKRNDKKTKRTKHKHLMKNAPELPNFEADLSFPESIKRIRKQNTKGLPYCYEKAAPRLHPRKDYHQYHDWLKAGKGQHPSYEEIEDILLNKKIENGCWVPTDCKTDQYLAVIIPYRQRKSNLMVFLYFMHNILQKQRRTYCIIVAEQYDFGQFKDFLFITPSTSLVAFLFQGAKRAIF